MHHHHDHTIRGISASLLRRLRTTSCLLAGLFATWGAFAENEPDDDTTAGATSLTFNGAKMATATGTTSTDDTDWYRIENAIGYDSFAILLEYDRIGSTSFHAIEILDADLHSVDFAWTDDDAIFDTATILIGEPKNDAVYYVGVRGSSGAEATYDLSIQATGGTPQTLWDYYYGLANSSYTYHASIGDRNTGLAFWFYYRAYGDRALRTAQGNSALAQKEFYLGLAYFYYTYLTGSSATYYYYLYIGYSELAYYSALGDSATAALYYNFYYALALSVL